MKIDIKSKKILILGIGGIGKCISHYLSKFFIYDINKLYLIDKIKEIENFITVKQLINKGANFICFDINDKNYKKFFTEMIEPESIIIDCTTRTPCIKWLKFLTTMNIYYINTSIECIPHYHDDVYLDSISIQHKQINKLKTQGKFLIEYGMNPGLITSFCYLALDDIAKYLNKKITNYAKFAEELNILDIHCSEIDTQIASKIDNSKFNNTWSAVALLDELKSGSEIYLGNKELNSEILNLKNTNKTVIAKHIDKNELLLTKVSSLENKAHSICYTQNIDSKTLKSKNTIQTNNQNFSIIEGYLIHHGEILDIGTMLKTKNYSPTIYYVYNINIEAEKALKKQSLDKLINESYDYNTINVMNNYNNKLNGTDNIGIYIRTKSGLEWWTGTVLSNEIIQKKLKEEYFGPTVIQVMCGVISGLSWLLQKANYNGIFYGRHVDHKYIFKKVGKYLNIKSEKI